MFGDRIASVCRLYATPSDGVQPPYDVATPLQRGHEKRPVPEARRRSTEAKLAPSWTGDIMDRRAVYVLTHPYRGNRYLNGTTREMKGRFPYALLQASARLTEGAAAAPSTVNRSG